MPRRGTLGDRVFHNRDSRRVVVLCAIARPADPYRGAADYVLLVQERSGHVLNAARQLAVIPKGLHKPLADYRADAQVGATLRREMEEELFGRSVAVISTRQSRGI
jgi:8-oxo-dGTP pyrophosphatase MutT (NUDIX family)